MNEEQNERELPELSNALLSADEVETLFADLAALTRVHEVLLKEATEGYVPENQGSVSLDEAKDLLLRRAVRGAQIRYVWAGKEYWDTLMAMPNGIRIVRICHD